MTIVKVQRTDMFWGATLEHLSKSVFKDAWNLADAIGKWFEEKISSAINPNLNYIMKTCVTTPRPEYQLSEIVRCEFFGPRLTIELVYCKRITRTGVEVRIVRTHEWEQFRGLFFVEDENNVDVIREHVKVHTDRAFRLMLLSKKF